MKMSTPRLLGTVVCSLLALTFGLPEPADAQYFGRNNPQYRTFDFRTLETDHFDIYFYPENEEAARDVARMAERWYARLSTILNHELSERQPVILYASHPDFQQTTILGGGGGIGEGTMGLTEAFKQRVVMPILGSYQDTDRLLGHELVHAFQYDISGLGRAGPAIIEVAQRFQAPLWFMEGQAEYLSIGPIDPHTAMWLRDAAVEGDLPTVAQMTRNPQRYFPYRWGHSLWAYVGGRWGDAVIGQILRQVGQGVPVDESFRRILNISLSDLSEEWHTAIRRAYLPLIEDLQEPHEVARTLFAFRPDEQIAGRVNVSPAISPDGRRMVFMSELDALDISLYVADVETGEVIRRLQRGTTFDPHFGSLRFIQSAGAWSPDGDQFVFSALRRGTDRLVFLDVERGRRLREVVMPGIHEITNPTWSPDGRTIVFTGIEGGLSNLYAVDLETEGVRQLTSDRHAAFQPEFSPDGQTIAFVTDQGPDASFETLHLGNYRIAVMDLATQEVTVLPHMETGKNINPSWGRDGTSLFFVSDRSGASNVYRLALDTDELFQVTNLFTGVSGITDSSPALSVARQGDRLVFSAYRNRGYAIYAIEGEGDMAGEPVTGVTVDADIATPDAPLAAIEVAGQPDSDPTIAILPPTPRPPEAAFNRVLAAVRDPLTGLPSPAQVARWDVVPYRARLSLDFLGQPTVGVGVGGGIPGGVGLAGGIFGTFSDMLGRHHLFGAIQAQGLIDEIGFAGTYLYMRDRWNYGVGVQRVPIIWPFYERGFTRVDGQDVFVDRIVRRRFFDWRLQGLAQYPFSRVMRADFSGGARRLVQSDRIIGIEIPVDEQGQPIGPAEEVDTTRPGESVNFLEGSGALIYDSSIFGFTSPIAGQRYRFEVSPMLGQVQATTGLADYRRYFFMRPFTFAFRGYHLGFYGRDAEGVERNGTRVNVLPQLFVGHPFWVRGYAPGSLWNDCIAEGQRVDAPSCRVFTQSSGSRVGVFNAEFRFPLIRRLELGLAPGGLPPVEGFLFGDAGIAWTQDISPRFQALDPDAEFDPVTGLASERGFLRSVGAGARVNVWGYLILEIAYVNAMDRPRGTHWQLAIQPGF